MISFPVSYKKFNKRKPSHLLIQGILVLQISAAKHWKLTQNLWLLLSRCSVFNCVFLKCPNTGTDTKSSFMIPGKMYNHNIPGTQTGWPGRRTNRQMGGGTRQRDRRTDRQMWWPGSQTGWPGRQTGDTLPFDPSLGSHTSLRSSSKLPKASTSFLS